MSTQVWKGTGFVPLPDPLVYFWIRKRDRKNRCYVIFAIRLKRKTEEDRKEELSVRLGKKSEVERFKTKVGVSRW